MRQCSRHLQNVNQNKSEWSTTFYFDLKQLVIFSMRRVEFRNSNWYGVAHWGIVVLGITVTIKKIETQIVKNNIQNLSCQRVPVNEQAKVWMKAITKSRKGTVTKRLCAQTTLATETRLIHHREGGSIPYTLFLVRLVLAKMWYCWKVVPFFTHSRHDFLIDYAWYFSSYFGGFLLEEVTYGPCIQYIHSTQVKK